MSTPPRRPRPWLYVGLVAVVALPVIWRLRVESRTSVPEGQAHPGGLARAALPNPRFSPSAPGQAAARRGEGTGESAPATSQRHAPPPRAAIPTPSAPPPTTPASPAEAAAMVRLREAVQTNPDEALALLDALDRAHPGASDAGAEERAALRVDAL